MEITINSKRLNVKADEMGTTIIVTTAQGEWQSHIYTEPIESEEELPQMLFNAMAPVCEATEFPSYRAWLDYLDHMGDTDPENREHGIYERYREKAEEWEQVSDGINPTHIIDYLIKEYDI